LKNKSLLAQKVLLENIKPPTINKIKRPKDPILYIGTLYYVYLE